MLGNHVRAQYRPHPYMAAQGRPVRSCAHPIGRWRSRRAGAPSTNDPVGTWPGAEPPRRRRAAPCRRAPRASPPAAGEQPRRRPCRGSVPRLLAHGTLPACPPNPAPAGRRPELATLTLDELELRWSTAAARTAITAEAMTGADLKAQALGTPGETLMEHAGHGRRRRRPGAGRVQRA